VARPAKSLASRVAERKLRRASITRCLPVRSSAPSRCARSRSATSRPTRIRCAALLHSTYEKALLDVGVLRLRRREADVSLSMAKFFPAMFSHVKGRAARRPFRLEACQRRFVTSSAA
jgi:hypothetical protein